MNKLEEYIVILDAGHGVNTPGKCSPDKSLLEYAYARDIVKRIAKELNDKGIKNHILVPELTDVSLRERCNRANLIYKNNNKKAILISVHCNAAGADGKWHSANGWQVCISKNASSNSKKLANCLFDTAKEENLKMRQPLPNLKYWVLNLAICRDTNCPAILTENLFLDNKEDVKFLLSEKGRLTITNLHINGIINYLNE